MKIKNRLSLYFTLVSSTILLIVMTVIYLSFYKFLQIDFFNRLKDRISIATRLYIEADEQSRADLTRVREKYQEKIPGEVIRIYDGGNDAAFIPDDKQYWPDNIINEVRENGDIEYSERGRYAVGMHYKDEHGDFVILASAQDPGRIGQLNRFKFIMASVFFLSIILVFSIGRWFAEKALSPINGLVAQLQKISATNLDTRVNVTQENDEIGLLARNFNHLLEQLQHSFELQKTFVANASHELRTPITSMIGEAEIALKQERSAGEYRAVIRSTLAESEKLNETITGLIDLAEVDVTFGRAQLVPIRVDDLVWELEEYWSKKLFRHALRVKMDRVSSDEASLIIQANKALLSIALNNLVGNAFKFSNNKPVSFTLETGNGLVKIKIQDKGIGIIHEDRERIFDAFYRSETAADYPGNGIGLYVTNKIVRMLKGEIGVLSIAGSGTVITLQFPNSEG
ncbi:sensor histidine kinase [Hufsiella ginkgonis]|uniref:Signal transduction histidine-protein kinase/phosphatase MprB n=1 Tax=Hufsiella ginkgonis TaxID=2695274 RepID=A0A7K1XVJ5_9SPHI|nr:ATP-binding protein [Hufsiella ginkgonis]MXV15000.1 HAMP domain-containing protein [Hufsiella ginkgonis]